MRIYSFSSETDPGRLRPGEDLVLHLEEEDVLATADGVAADDHLRPGDRANVEQAAAHALVEWLDKYRDRLTLNGVPLAKLIEHRFATSILIRTVRIAHGLLLALDHYRPSSIDVAANGQGARLVQAIGRAADIDVRFVQPTSASETFPPRRKRHHRPLATAVGCSGLPSLLRRDAIVTSGYWSMVPMIDAMLAGGRHRLALDLRQRPPSWRRSVAMSLSGGWAATASSGRRRTARHAVAAALGDSSESGIQTAGAELSEVLHLGLAEWSDEIGDHLAEAVTLRQTWARKAPRLVTLPSDATPHTRILVHAAREAAVPSLAIAHGAYLTPLIVGDLEYADHAAAWSPHAAQIVAREPPDLHIVGYPLDPPVAPRRRRHTSATVVVLEHRRSPSTALVDERISLRHFTTAVQALESAAKDIRIILRPHPSQRLHVVEAIASQFPDSDIRIDRTTPILDLLAGADLCVGSISTATLEAAMRDVPVVVLNVSGQDWPPPLGGSTSVPISRSVAELREWVNRGLGGGGTPGRAELVETLGVRPPGEATAARIDLIDRLMDAT